MWSWLFCLKPHLVQFHTVQNGRKKFTMHCTSPAVLGGIPHPTCKPLHTARDKGICYRSFTTSTHWEINQNQLSHKACLNNKAVKDNTLPLQILSKVTSSHLLYDHKVQSGRAKFLALKLSRVPWNTSSLSRPETSTVAIFSLRVSGCSAISTTWSFPTPKIYRFLTSCWWLKTLPKQRY